MNEQPEEPETFVHMDYCAVSVKYSKVVDLLLFICFELYILKYISYICIVCCCSSFLLFYQYFVCCSFALIFFAVLLLSFFDLFIARLFHRFAFLVNWFIFPRLSARLLNCLLNVFSVTVLETFVDIPLIYNLIII